MTRTPDYLVRNRRAWDKWSKTYEESGRRAWATQEITLGCGTAYFSSWLARRGAPVVGIDNSPAQLANARRFQQEFGVTFPLIQASAEAVPLPDAGFDLAVSEYGAAIWSDPYLWIPEAARLLRPGGQLIFLVNATVLVLCMPEEADAAATDRLLNDYFGMHRFEWPDVDEAVEFPLGYGDWIRLLRRAGFEVEDLIEVRAPEGATTRYPYVTGEWARRWPSEEIWQARKRG